MLKTSVLKRKRNVEHYAPHFYIKIVFMKSIITKKGKLPGKTVAIFAGIHGNERAGISIVEDLIMNLEVIRGTVHLVFGNPAAIKAQARFIESNLNRDFIKVISPKTYEQKRAVTLMKLLDTCDALLDLHAYRSSVKNAAPFAIAEPRCHKIISKFNVPFSIASISSFQGGSTNGYMEQQNKVGIVLELGAIEKPEKYKALGKDCVLTFLSHFGNINNVNAKIIIKPKYLKVTGVYRKNTKNFTFTKKYQSFDQVLAKEPIARDGGLIVSAVESGYILFPSDKDAVGLEAFWLLLEA
jgi:succinylglutamate desuccinylase